MMKSTLNRPAVYALLITVMLACAGCGQTAGQNVPEEDQNAPGTEQSLNDTADGGSGEKESADTGDPDGTSLNDNSNGPGEGSGAADGKTGIANETASDSVVDFDILEAENPDIYAWLYIPDTGIDYPIVRAGESDDQYTGRGPDGSIDERGAVYTQMYNSPDFSDFNTIIHGADASEEDYFHELHDYENPDYFDAHRTMYIVTPYTTLTYEIIAAYYDEGSDIIRRYDYTTYAGCDRWITEYQNHNDLAMNRVDPVVEMSVDTSFLVTLDTPVNDSGKQFVVIASMTDSGFVTLERYVSDEDEEETIEIE